MSLQMQKEESSLYIEKSSIILKNAEITVNDRGRLCPEQNSSI